GLIPIASFGRHLGLPTPFTESLIQMACGVTATNYWLSGRTEQSLGLADMSPADIRHHVETGLKPDAPAPAAPPIPALAHAQMCPRPRLLVRPVSSQRRKWQRGGAPGAVPLSRRPAVTRCGSEVGVSSHQWPRHHTEGAGMAHRGCRERTRKGPGRQGTFAGHGRPVPAIDPGKADAPGTPATAGWERSRPRTDKTGTARRCRARHGSRPSA